MLSRIAASMDVIFFFFFISCFNYHYLLCIFSVLPPRLLCLLLCIGLDVAVWCWPNTQVDLTLLGQRQHTTLTASHQPMNILARLSSAESIHVLVGAVPTSPATYILLTVTFRSFKCLMFDVVWLTQPYTETHTHTPSHTQHSTYTLVELLLVGHILSLMLSTLSVFRPFDVTGPFIRFDTWRRGRLHLKPTHVAQSSHSKVTKCSGSTSHLTEVVHSYRPFLETVHWPICRSSHETHLSPAFARWHCTLSTAIGLLTCRLMHAYHVSL